MFEYKFIEEELTFDQAVLACENIGMHLAYIDSQEENDFIVSLDPGSTTSGYWIGLRDTTDGTFLWESRILSSESLTPVFDNNLGSGDVMGTGCVQMFLKQSWPFGGWDDIDCTTKRKSICKGRDLSQYKKESNGFEEFFYKAVMLKKDMDDAEIDCERFGMHLASIHSYREMLHIQNVVREEALHVDSENYWIGLKDVGDDEVYKWIDNTPLSYTNWDDGQPSPTTASCASFTLSTGKWKLEDCTSATNVYGYVCKNRKTYDPDMFNYRVFIREIDFPDSEKVCQKFGMELASIHSSDENAYIYSLIPLADRVSSNHLYIGINDKDDENTYVGSDGTASDYTNWAPTEPNPSAMQECIVMNANTGFWHDVVCTTDFEGFICKSKNPNYKRQCKDEEHFAWACQHEVLEEREAGVLDICDRFPTKCEKSCNNCGAGSYITPQKNLVTRHEEVCTKISKSSSHECIKKRHVIDILPSELWMLVPRESISSSFGIDCTSDRFCVLVDYRRKYGFSGEPTQWSDFEICLEEFSNYKVFHPAATFTNAQQTCRDNGMELASIHSSEENAHILSLIQLANPPPPPPPNPSNLVLLMIGINDIEEADVYVGTDGTASDYKNFISGEPNDVNERCIGIHVDTGLWYDITCETILPVMAGFVCKYTNFDLLGQGTIVQPGQVISTLPGQGCHSSQNRQTLRALENAGETTESNCWHRFAYVQTNGLCGVEDIPIYLTATRGVDILEIGAIRYATELDCPIESQLIRMCPTVVTPKSG